MTPKKKKKLQWVRVGQPFSLPAEVKKAMEVLDSAGFIAYVVGGSVRDFMLEVPPKDHDIATNATPDEVIKLFKKTVPVGKSFGVVKVIIDEREIEVTTFRKDKDYSDHRHPDGIEYAGPEEDARRRDFTINALYYNPKTHKVLDTEGGIKDIQGKKVRAIGDPTKRFQEDALRLLRAIRFSTAMGFKLELNTGRAIKVKSYLLRKISAERIRDELSAMLTGPRPSEAFRLLSDLGILSILIPELEATKKIKESPVQSRGITVWEHTLKVLKHMETEFPVRSKVLAWAVLFHEIGKPAASVRSDGKNFNGYEIDGAEITEKICHRLKFSNDRIDGIKVLVSEHQNFANVFQMRESTLKRWIQTPYFDDLMALHKCATLASFGNLAFYEFCQNQYDEMKDLLKKKVYKLISGEDLIQLGLSPGPKFSQILKTVEDLALEKRLHNKDEALEFVVKHFVK